MSRILQIACDYCGELIENYIMVKRRSGAPKKNSHGKDMCNDCKERGVKETEEMDYNIEVKL
jgi:hypothetical protein